MTELLEKRIQAVIDSIDAGIVTLADAQFLVQLLKLQAKRMEELGLLVTQLHGPPEESPLCKGE